MTAKTDLTGWQRPSFCSKGGCPTLRRWGSSVQLGTTGSEGTLSLSNEEWATLKRAIKAGEFDGPEDGVEIGGS